MVKNGGITGGNTGKRIERFVANSQLVTLVFKFQFLALVGFAEKECNPKVRIPTGFSLL